MNDKARKYQKKYQEKLKAQGRNQQMIAVSATVKGRLESLKCERRMASIGATISSLLADAGFDIDTPESSPRLLSVPVTAEIRDRLVKMANVQGRTISDVIEAAMFPTFAPPPPKAAPFEFPPVEARRGDYRQPRDSESAWPDDVDDDDFENN